MTDKQRERVVGNPPFSARKERIQPKSGQNSSVAFMESGGFFSKRKNFVHKVHKTSQYLFHQKQDAVETAASLNRAYFLLRKFFGEVHVANTLIYVGSSTGNKRIESLQEKIAGREVREEEFRSGDYLNWLLGKIDSDRDLKNKLKSIGIDPEVSRLIFMDVNHYRNWIVHEDRGLVLVDFL